MKNPQHLLLEKTHVQRNKIRDLILGGQDGLVNVLGIVFGVTAAGGAAHIVLAAGMAATFAEAVSMAAVNYTSTLSERDYYLKELAQERNEIAVVPAEEKDEIRAIYKRKGFDGKLLDQIVDQLTKDKGSWARTMMLEEHKQEPIIASEVMSSSLIVGLSTIGGSFIPLLPFFVLPPHQAVVISSVLSAAALFMVGFFQAKSYVGNPLTKGAQMVLIGMGASLIGFGIGKLFHATM